MAINNEKIIVIAIVIVLLIILLGVILAIQQHITRSPLCEEIAMEEYKLENPICTYNLVDRCECFEIVGSKRSLRYQGHIEFYLRD